MLSCVHSLTAAKHEEWGENRMADRAFWIFKGYVQLKQLLCTFCSGENALVECVYRNTTLSKFMLLCRATSASACGGGIKRRKGVHVT